MKKKLKIIESQKDNNFQLNVKKYYKKQFFTLNLSS